MGQGLPPSVLAEPALTAQVQRLRQFLRFNIPVNLLIACTMAAIWYFTRFWSLTWVSGMVFAYAGLLGFARYQLRSQRVEVCVFCVAAGAVVLDVAGAFLSGGSVMPTLALLTLWPVMLALPYLRKRGMLLLMATSTAAALVLTIASIMGDVVGLMAAVPAWVSLAVNGFCMPVFVGFMCLVLWHYSSHLEDTVAQLREANSSLLESERVLEQRVAERTEQLALQNDQLTRLDEMKTRFLSNASHELRSPLTSIRAFSELLADDPGLTEMQLEFARTINLESERLSRLTNELLDLSRIESGVIRWQPRRLDMRAEVAKLVEAQWLVARQKGLALECDVPDELPAVWADPDALRQVLLNLTNNAIKFTEQGRILIAVAAKQRTVGVEISDTGPGISEFDQAHVFDRFYQAGNVLTEKPAGAGLGLAICREILEQHGSELRLQSTLGAGSSFSFELAIADR